MAKQDKTEAPKAEKAVKIKKEKPEKKIEVVEQKTSVVEEKVEKKIEPKKKEVIVEPEVKQLSPAAQKWLAYLQMQKLDPIEFIKKYKQTNHRHLHLIEEIVEFQKSEK